MNTRITAILTAAVLAAALAACGSSDDKTAPAAASPTAPAAQTSTPAAPAADDGTAALEKAVTAYTAAYFAADTDAAYSALSARCTGKISKAQYEAIVEQAKTDYGPDHPATNVHAQVSGQLARVTYKVKGLPKFDQTDQPWARENGTWHYDAC